MLRFFVRLFLCFYAMHGCTMLATSECEQFINLTKDYYTQLSASSTFSNPSQLQQIKAQLPSMQKCLQKEITSQKKHVKELKKDPAAKPSELGEARIELQEKLRLSHDILPLQQAIARAQWVLSPKNESFKKRATALSQKTDAATEDLARAEENLDAAWEDATNTN